MGAGYEKMYEIWSVVKVLKDTVADILATKNMEIQGICIGLNSERKTYGT